MLGSQSLRACLSPFSHSGGPHILPPPPSHPCPLQLRHSSLRTFSVQGCAGLSAVALHCSVLQTLSVDDCIALEHIALRPVGLPALALGEHAICALGCPGLLLTMFGLQRNSAVEMALNKRPIYEPVDLV